LFVIDPSDYRIAVDQAQAIVEEAKERMTLARAEAVRRTQLSEVVVSIEQKQIYEICACDVDAEDVDLGEPHTGAPASK
jgi:multidrug resistance efflux pump